MTVPPFVTQRALQSLWCVNHHVFIFIVIFGSPAVDAPSRNLIILCPIRWSQFTTLTSNTTKVIKETKSENSNNKQKKWKSDYPSWCTYSPALTKRDSVMWKNLKNHESAIITWCCFLFVNLKENIWQNVSRDAPRWKETTRAVSPWLISLFVFIKEKIDRRKGTRTRVEGG